MFISGRGSNLRALAQACAAGEIEAEIVVVLSDKKNAPGIEIAREFSLPVVIETRKKKQRSTVEFNLALAQAVKPFQPDLIVFAGFMRVVTAEFLKEFPDKVINIHPSLLPAFPGLDVQRRAIEAGVKFSGCTVHYLIEEVDAGPIIAQAVVPVLPEDSVETLSARILRQEHKLLPAVVGAIARGEEERACLREEDALASMR